MNSPVQEALVVSPAISLSTTLSLRSPIYPLTCECVPIQLLKPIGLAQSNGKRPGKVVCLGCYVASHIQVTLSMVGVAATSAEQDKRRKYKNLDSSFILSLLK
ncbi:jg15787 [Pararge aegeria aegeria]|uniref:Jg15787 protein n=1 Tax=Pararge aegeria aegeria TaxID=348720 RepID=A0A8S4RMG9_9NEOP|nr:jg15787 [Pararge aegeria aegeria]